MGMATVKAVDDDLKEIMKVSKENAKIESTFNHILDLMEQRLNQAGEIRTNDAYILLREKYNYFTIAACFKTIMDTMCEQKKATKIRNGLWKIHGNQSQRL